VGAVFTIAAYAEQLPSGTPFVLLDDAPRSARVVSGGVSRDVDLGSHVGMRIEGDPDAMGRDDEAAIVYTSAMAGTSLGAILTHRNLLANARSTVVAAANASTDVVLALLPFSHLFGLTVTASAPLLAGARVVTMPKFNPVRAAELIARGGITEVVGVPAVFRGLLAAIERHADGRPRDLRACICGGAPLSRELQDRWFDVTGVELSQGYGLTEAGPVCLFNHAGRDNVRGTLGEPFPGVEVDLREPITYDAHGDPRGDASAVGGLDVGEICVRGDNVFRGYVSGGEHGLPVRGGWLYTGDLGRRGGDGRIAFDGIAKPMFTRNGFNIYPREIERAVSELPGVVAVAAREVPQGDRESDIALEVRGAVDAETVKEWCGRRLSVYKQPASITFL
ncbi:MAG: AMP-binding protein, partial [bacterium]